MKEEKGDCYWPGKNGWVCYLEGPGEDVKGKQAVVINLETEKRKWR